MNEKAASLLRRHRLRVGLTQTQLAERLGVSQQQIAKLEDPAGNPSLRTLAAAFDALGLRLSITVTKRKACR